MITILDKYIGKAFLYYFFLGLLVFLSLFLIVDFMVTTSRFDVGMDVIGLYYVYYVFEMIHKLIPVACLMATVFCISQLNANSELVALFSLGWSLLRVSLPILVLVGVISMASFLFSNELMPEILDRKNEVYLSKMKKQPWKYTSSKREKIWYRSGQNLYNISLLNSQEKKAFGVTVYTFSPDWRLQQILSAKEADITDGRWRLKYGQVRVFFEDEAAPIAEPFEERVLEFGEDVIDIKVSTKAAEGMGVNELRRYISRNKKAGLNTTVFEVDYHEKFSFLLTALVMALLGIPFSSSSQRSGGVFANIQICLLLTLVYWIVYNSGLTMGRHGSLTPVVAAWGPNLVMAILATYLIRRNRA